MNMVFPEAFEERMRKILGNEYEAFVLSLNGERVQGLRFNTLKAPLEEEKAACQSKFDLRRVPWCSEGFIYDPNTRPGRHPYHNAGLYYIQEPSAMAAVELMDVRPGEKILDLCAAPGGKSSQIAEKLDGKGLLISNEINASRAKTLSQNIERMGVRNTVVTQEDPKTLSDHFKGFFDKVLVDAPCSGEGMFRKDEEALGQWSVENVMRCAERDQQILSLAAQMLKPGGSLLYSTCTFEPEEDEMTVSRFLDDNRDFSLAEDKGHEGFSDFCRCDPVKTAAGAAMYKIWPHKTDGEGHFMALLKKTSQCEETYPVRSKRKNSHDILKEKEIIALADRELGEIFNDNNFKTVASEKMTLAGSGLFVIPDNCPPLEGLHVLRPGLCIGNIRKNRFEPSHALALFVKAEDSREVISLDSEGERISQYLGGNTIPADHPEKGWVLVCVDGYSLGWGKAVGEVLKNHYPKGLRRTL